VSDPFKDATYKLVSYALTVGLQNTDEWLDGFVDTVNAWAESTGEEDRVRRRGDGLEILKANAVRGFEVGEKCNRDGCEGVLEWDVYGECMCFDSPPCYWCVTRRVCCPECQWSEEQ